MARSPGSHDFRDGTKKGEKPSPPEDRLPDSQRRRWWTQAGTACAQSIGSNVMFLQKAQSPRIRQMVISSRLYGNTQAFGGGSAAYARLLQLQSAAKDRITYNAIQSIIDTATAKIGENKPRPYFLTSGGSYQQQRKAKKLNKYVEGVFYENKTYDIGLKAFRDAAIWGDGFLHVFGRAGRVVHERVLGAELWVDEIEAQYGFPRNMNRVKVVDRDELASYFPEKRKDIMRSDKAIETVATQGQNLSDMVTVAESWHLGGLTPEGEMVGGKHAIALVGADAMLLEPEDWEHNFFPFARMPWCERPVGYWSQGLSEQLQGEQLELNKELFLIQRSMHLAGTLKVFLKNGSKVSKEHINNEIGAIINHTGDAPVFYCPEPIHPVYFENVNRIIERMYRKAGVSEMSASAKKPQGLNAGVAIREFEDIESDRHRTVQRQNDNLYLATCALTIAISQELAAAGDLKPVRVPGRQNFDELDFKRDIGNLKESEFVMQCFPVSRLPRDPSGRLQTIQEYIQAGFMTPRQGRRALDFPDLEAVESLANAQEDVLTMVLDDIVDKGEYAPPEPTDDLQMAKEMVVEVIQRMRTLDLEPERMDLLRNWNSQVDMMQQLAMPPPSPIAAPGQPGTPQARPMPAPQSDLLQQAA